MGAQKKFAAKQKSFNRKPLRILIRIFLTSSFTRFINSSLCTHLKESEHPAYENKKLFYYFARLEKSFSAWIFIAWRKLRRKLILNALTHSQYTFVSKTLSSRVTRMRHERCATCALLESFYIKFILSPLFYAFMREHRRWKICINWNLRHCLRLSKENEFY